MTIMSIIKIVTVYILAWVVSKFTENSDVHYQ